MDILSLLIIATGLSMDSFAVCIGKGMCRKRFNTWRAFRIALVFALFQGLMPLTGYALSVGFAQWIQQFDHWLAFIILAVIGLKMIRETFLTLPIPSASFSVCTTRLPCSTTRST